MIRSLRGRVIEKDIAWVLFEVAGVGYQVYVPSSVLSNIAWDEDTFLYIHDHPREDNHDLFGFTSATDLRFFEQLLGISGVGPKVAMTIMSIGAVETVRRAIMSGDLTTLTSVSGVGKKTAQKIILELKGQLVDTDDASDVDHDVIEGLKALGYSAVQARDALKHVPLETTATGERIRQALRILAQ